jgi:hypothetical protein
MKKWNLLKKKILFILVFIVSFYFIGILFDLICLYIQTGSPLLKRAYPVQLIEKPVTYPHCRTLEKINRSRNVVFFNRQTEITVQIVWPERNVDLLTWLLHRMLPIDKDNYIYTDMVGKVIFTPFQYKRRKLKNVKKNILVVGKWSESIPNISYGAIFLGDEDCENLFLDDPRLLFAFTTYGRCAKYPQNLKHWDIWPLGPKVHSPFRKPVSLFKYKNKNRLKKVPPWHNRHVFLYNVMTITPSKLSRMQAQLTAERLCKGHFCLLNNRLSLLRFLLFPSSQLHYENLIQSKFTLCPFGNNPENYRIWEAILAGSLPIVEDRIFKIGYCDSANQHAVLRKFNAPVFFVDDWDRDLPLLLNNTDDFFIQKQRELLHWTNNFCSHLLQTLIAQIRRHFIPN